MMYYCNCPDKEYELYGSGRKHTCSDCGVTIVTTGEIPKVVEVDDNLVKNEDESASQPEKTE